MAPIRRLAAAVLAVTLAACGDRSGGGAPTRTTLQAGWNPVPGMRCADGSPTGIGLSPGRADAVLVVLGGGGACWGAQACSSSVPRRFGQSEFQLAQSLLVSGSILDRQLPGNPFASWTQVFVPYCTGDVHAGDAVADHGGTSWDHHGWRNLRAAVGVMTAALPRPAHLVVAGSSAGGLGVLVAYDLVRAGWDPQGGTTAALLDDSGPTFVGTATPPALLAAWWADWALSTTVGTSCAACASDLSAFWPALHARHPGDRLALLSTVQDATMRAFLADPAVGAPMDGAVFQASLDALVRHVGTLDGTFAAYRIGGAAAESHAVLARDSLFDPTFLQSPQGPALLDWVSALVTLDPSWASTTAL